MPRPSFARSTSLRAGFGPGFRLYQPLSGGAGAWVPRVSPFLRDLGVFRSTHVRPSQTQFSFVLSLTSCPRRCTAFMARVICISSRSVAMNASRYSAARIIATCYSKFLSGCAAVIVS